MLHRPFPSLRLYRLIALLLMLALASCTHTKPVEQNFVVAQLPSEPPTLHTVNASNASAQYLTQYTQKTLTRIDLRTLQQIPILVKGLAAISSDGKSYTYELRDDVRWDDGSPLTVDDVIFTLKLNKCPLTDNAEQRSVYDNIYDIRKDSTNPQRFTMLAKTAYYKNPDLFDEMNLVEKKFWDPKGVLDNIAIPAMDAADFKPDAYPGLAGWMTAFNSGENGHDPAKLGGLGPYKLTAWLAGNLTLERKKDWWGRGDTSIYSKAYPEKIIFKVMSDDPGLVLALKKKSLDVITVIGTAQLNELRQSKEFNDNYYSGFTNLYSYNYIGLNEKPEGSRQPFFTDQKVRRAVACLVPVDEIVKTIAMGNGTRQASFVQPLYKEYYNDTLKIIPFDIEKAKQLLTEAGWTDTDGDNIRDKVINGKKVPMHIQYTYRASDVNKEIALMIKDAMYKAGIDLQLDGIDGNVVFKRMLDHDFDMISSAWSGSAIPEDPEQIFHTSNWANHGYNFTGFGDAESDRLIELSNRAIDRTERIKYLKALQAKIYEDQPYIFTYAVKRKIAISKRFENTGMYDERPGVILNALKLKGADEDALMQDNP